MSAGGFYASKAKEGGEERPPVSAVAAGEGGVATSRVPGDELPGALLRKLKVLGYPDLVSACLSGEAYCRLVLWLEEEKIRLYEPKDRKVLRDFTKAWYQHIVDYGKELGIPAAGLSETHLPKKLQVLNSLVNLAIHDVYRDKVDSKEVKLEAPPEPAMGAAEQQQLRDLVPPINRILEHLALPKLGGDAADTDAVAALRCIKTRLEEPSKSKADLDIDNLPTGLELDDKDVRRVAGVLRLLHGIEMQQLQVNINNVVNDLQQVTADPKTDARLGRVGT